LIVWSRSLDILESIWNTPKIIIYTIWSSFAAFWNKFERHDVSWFRSFSAFIHIWKIWSVNFCLKSWASIFCWALGFASIYFYAICFCFIILFFRNGFFRWRCLVSFAVDPWLEISISWLPFILDSLLIFLCVPLGSCLNLKFCSFRTYVVNYKNGPIWWSFMYFIDVCYWFNCSIFYYSMGVSVVNICWPFININHSNILESREP